MWNANARKRHAGKRADTERTHSRIDTERTQNGHRADQVAQVARGGAGGAQVARGGARWRAVAQVAQVARGGAGGAGGARWRAP